MNPKYIIWLVCIIICLFLYLCGIIEDDMKYVLFGSMFAIFASISIIGL